MRERVDGIFERFVTGHFVAAWDGRPGLDVPMPQEPRPKLTNQVTHQFTTTRSFPVRL